MIPMKTLIHILTAASTLALLHAQGPLTPPDVPGPTMKTLDQVEARIPISSGGTVINNPGSYYLTRNLIVTDPVNGISVLTDNVVIDLNGYTIAWTGDGGTPAGISGSTNITVRNGYIKNWPGYGINLGPAAVVEDVTVESCGNDGVRVGEKSRVRRCRVDACSGGNGIKVDAFSLIEGCLSVANGSYGINSGASVIISGCVAYNNQSIGIYSGAGATISGCVAYQNQLDGIYSQSGATISGCSAYQNQGIGIYGGDAGTVSGCSTTLNKGDGIRVGTACVVTNNSCRSNGSAGDGAGIRAESSQNRIESNNVTFNTRGVDVNSAGNFIVRNSASLNGTNYDIVANNKVGVVVAAPDSGVISGSTGGAGVGSTDPWANFSF
jgi:hypothetical protein